MQPLIGNITLNISLVLYLINYIPQLWHNYRGKQLSGFSIYFHNLLFLSSLTDLIYGFGLQLPWQYRLVSLSGVLCLTIQHCQMKKIMRPQSFLKINIFFAFILVLGVIFLFFKTHSTGFFTILGYLSQTSAFICAFPQIVKNALSLSALSLSLLYLTLDLLCNLCDNASAWLLSWPMPSKVGAVFSTAVCLLLMYQCMTVKRRSSNCRAPCRDALP